MADQRSTDPILDVRNLRKTFGGDEGLTAVEDVSFTVDRGEVVGLLGPNGAGKTTTIKSCLGLIRPSGGTVRVEGRDLHDNPRETYRAVGAVLEGARNVYWRLSVRENLRFFAGLQGTHPDAASERIDRLLEALGLSMKADETARTLSRGMQQKLALGCALVRETPLLFLDEPTLGLDVEASRDLRAELRRLVEERDRAVVLSSHDMDVIREVADRVVILEDGRVLVDDPVEDLVDLFRTRTYRFRFETAEGAHQATTAFDAEWDGDALEVTVHQQGRLYDLMDRLRDAGVVVDSVETVDPDLEEIFLELTGSDDGRVNGDRRDTAVTDPDGVIRA